MAKVLTGTEATICSSGPTGDDRLDGRGGDDEIEGGGGNDRLKGGGGDDEMEGGTGNDEIIPGEGDDEVDAGAGNDSVYARDTDGVDYIDCGGGFDKVETIHRDDRTKSDCERSLGLARVTSKRTVRVSSHFMHPPLWRTCLEKSWRRLERKSLAARVGRSGLLRPLLTAFVAPIRPHSDYPQVLRELRRCRRELHTSRGRGRLVSSSPRERSTPLSMALKNPRFLCRSRPDIHSSSKPPSMPL